MNNFEVDNNISAGDIVGEDNVGGILGNVNGAYADGNEIRITNCASYATTISGNSSVGNIVGGYCGEEENNYYEPSVLMIENCSSTTGMGSVGGYYTFNSDSGIKTFDPDYALKAARALV